MPSRKTIIEQNTVYHVFNNGFKGKTIFHDVRDYARFFGAISRYMGDFGGIDIMSYCVTPDHFHLLIASSISGLEISNFMRKVQQSYALYYSKKYSSSRLNLRGQLFDGRFKARPIYDDEYLIRCQAYINYDALRHSVVENIVDWPYTSLHDIIDTGRRSGLSIKLSGYSKELENYKNVDLKDFDYYKIISK